MLRSEDQGTHAIGSYIRRARQERELAARASTAEGAEAHLRLARHYEALISSAEPVHESAAADRDHPGLFVNSAVQTYLGARLPAFAAR